MHFYQLKLSFLVYIILLLFGQTIHSQEPDSLWMLDLQEIKVKAPRMDYKKLLQGLIKIEKAKLNKARTDNLVYELTYTGILDKEIQETGKATISVTNNKRRWYTKYRRIKALTYNNVGSIDFICETKNYGMGSIFFEDPMCHGKDILYYDLAFKNSEVKFNYDGTNIQFMLSVHKEPRAEYYFNVNKSIDSIVVYKYPTFTRQIYIDKEIKKEDITYYKAVYVYGNSRLDHASVRLSFIKEEHPVELKYELNFLETEIDNEDYLLLDSDGSYLPTSFTFEEAWRLRRVEEVD